MSTLQVRIGDWSVQQFVKVLELGRVDLIFSAGDDRREERVHVIIASDPVNLVVRESSRDDLVELARREVSVLTQSRYHAVRPSEAAAVAEVANREIFFRFGGKPNLGE